jgi:hypothetical protein
MGDRRKCEVNCLLIHRSEIGTLNHNRLYEQNRESIRRAPVNILRAKVLLSEITARHRSQLT